MARVGGCARRHRGDTRLRGGDAVPGAQGVAGTRAAAEKAFRAGKFDEVHTLAQAAAGDEALALLNARAYVAQGDYPKAETLLTPLAAARPAGDAALELGLLQLYLGRRSEGRRTMTLLMLADVREANAKDYARAARAARALGRFEEANSFFREAIAIAPNDAPINTAWGDLFLEKHNRADAQKSYQAALKAEPDYAPAQLGLARALSDENPPASMRYVRRALELNPSDAGAYLFLAELALDEDKKTEARAAIQRALAINAEQHRSARARRRAWPSSRARKTSTRRRSPRRSRSTRSTARPIASSGR